MKFPLIVGGQLERKYSLASTRVYDPKTMSKRKFQRNAHLTIRMKVSTMVDDPKHDSNLA
jgi:hypothetical protein